MQAKPKLDNSKVNPNVQPYELPSLPYDYDALEPHYDAAALELHHSKHHAAYVDGANETLSKLWEARSHHDYDTLNMLQKNLAFHLSGHVLHSMFWKNLSPDGGGDPSDELVKALERGFDGVQLFKEQFTNAASGIQGSGWAALSWDPVSASLVVEQIYDHQGNTGNGTIPLLVLDMWEHAFYLQHQNVKADWIEKFWDMVNWKDVEQRLANVAQMNLSLD